jgi:AcrR family transcriptional regulator
MNNPKTPVPGTPGYKEQKKALREEKIVNVAQGIFAKKGLEKTSMEEIAARVPISKATLYRHFSNKYALFLRVVRKELAEFRAEMEATIAEESDPVRRLKRYCKYRFTSLRRLINLYKVQDLRSVSRHPYFIRHAARYRVTERQIVSTILEYGIEKGVFKRLNPIELSAETIVIALNGIEQVWAFSELTDEEISKRVDEMVNALYMGIARKNSRK